MVMIAVGLCLKQTIDFRDSLSGTVFVVLLGLQAVLAGVIAASAISLLRKRFARQKKPVSRRPVPVTA